MADPDVLDQDSPATRVGSTDAGPEQLSSEDKRSVRIVTIDDERTLRESCKMFLEAEGYRVETAGRGAEALELLKRRAFDIALIDLNMSEVHGMELLAAGLEKNPDTIAIIMTGNASVGSSIEALRAGAWDYLPKPFSATHLQILIGRAAHAVIVARESSELQRLTDREHGHSEKVTVLGQGASFRAAIELARKVARTDASVFITGESGTGKELFAQFIHHHSRRSSRPLVAINCAALPEALLESEMFGHRKGAFTGAVRDKAGLLEIANGGTMFLDELGEMPKSIQAKLLRVIQDGVVRRVGSETNDAVVNVRFIAATNRDTETAVRAGQLREDLYYRLRVVLLEVPSLRERREDIPLLVETFIREFNREHGRKVNGVTRGAMDRLMHHEWPGNVRELKNTIEEMVIFTEGKRVLDVVDLPLALRQQRTPSAPDLPLHVGMSMQEIERAAIDATMRSVGDDKQKAAKVLGIGLRTLYRKLKEYGL